MIIKDILILLDNQHYEYVFKGDENTDVNGFASLQMCEPGKITWVKQQENYNKLERKDGVTLAVVQDGVSVDIPNQIITPASKEVFFAVLHHFWGRKRNYGFIGEGSVISNEAIIDSTVTIGYNCSIVGNIKIGANTLIENNVVIQGDVVIGERCHIQSHAVIGIDGYGYSKDQETGKKTMVEHFGGVKIGNDVFVGSHVNIARGTIDDTMISDGVKICPSTHIGHNTFIGENASIICANLFGSTWIGKDAYIVDSTIQNQSSVGERTVIGMGSVVTKPISDNIIAYGIPAKPIRNNDSNL